MDKLLDEIPMLDCSTVHIRKKEKDVSCVWQFSVVYVTHTLKWMKNMVLCLRFYWKKEKYGNNRKREKWGENTSKKKEKKKKKKRLPIQKIGHPRFLATNCVNAIVAPRPRLCLTPPLTLPKKTLESIDLSFLINYESSFALLHRPTCV